MNKNRIFNFTNTYIGTDYPDFEPVDCSGLSGTDMYCDDEAGHAIIEKIRGEYGGIHLIDSGNYHYMTRLFTSLINEPYELVFFDNHTDMKPAMFDMLSCGSWAKAVLDHDKNIRRLVMIGPPEKSFNELPGEIGNDERLLYISGEEAVNIAERIKNENIQKIHSEMAFCPEPETSLPVYISVDKDVLSAGEVLTNWDQGNMKLSELILLIGAICGKRRLMGADICGLYPTGAGESEALLAYRKGLDTDRRLIGVLGTYMNNIDN